MPKYLIQYPNTVISNSKEYEIHWKINFTKLAVTVGQEVLANMWVYFGDAIDENPAFISEKALLVPVNKRNLAGW